MSDEDFEVAIYCNDPSHEERTIARFRYFPKPETRSEDGRTAEVFGWLVWRELQHEDPAQPPALQTLFGEARRLGEIDKRHHWRDHLENLIRPVAGNSGFRYATRYRFECRGCRTVPIKGERMEEILNGARLAGVDRLSLPQLSASM